MSKHITIANLKSKVKEGIRKAKFRFTQSEIIKSGRCLEHHQSTFRQKKAENQPPYNSPKSLTGEIASMVMSDNMDLESELFADEDQWTIKRQRF